MNYKETLFFIGQCLTIAHDKENLTTISKKIKAGEVNWDDVVKISTGHYVYPALYCNLYRTNLISYLPNDLIAHMEHITNLNRERNVQIVEQAKEINTLLSKNGIRPIFIKGTGFLLQDFYNDIAERMVGDIDFLVSKADFKKTIKVLESIDYSYVVKSKYHYPSYKHHPRVHKKNRIAAVEIHHEMTIDKYKKEFNYNSVINKCIEKNGFLMLNNDDMLSLTIIAKQINDNGQYFKTMNLRNGYDVFLMAQKINPIKILDDYDLLFKPLNNFLAISNIVFHSKKISFIVNNSSQNYISIFNKILTDHLFRKKHSLKWKRRLFWTGRISFILRSFVKKEYRYWLFKRVTDRKWHKEKMMQLGFKSKI